MKRTRAKSKAKGKIRKPYAERIAAVRAVMAEKDLDAYLIQSRMDQYWLTGFTGEDGAVVLTHRAVILLTDGRFDENADREAPYAKKVLRKARTPATNALEIKKTRAKRIGYDPSLMSVAEFKVLKKECKPAGFVEAGGLFGPLRARKDKGEIKTMRQAIDVAQKAFLATMRWVKPGLTERAIAAKLVYEMQKRGAMGETFPSIVASGPNSSIPHATPGDRKLKKNEILLFDWGAHVDWYGSDLTRVMWLGSIPRRLRKIYDIVRESHDAGIEAVRPGVTAHEVDRAARRVIEKAGFGKRFNHATGHGVGLVAHEIPRIGKGTETELQEGMVITIEPGIYLPGVGGVRLEDDILVTKRGYEVLTTLPLELS